MCVMKIFILKDILFRNLVIFFGLCFFDVMRCLILKGC